MAGASSKSASRKSIWPKMSEMFSRFPVAKLSTPRTCSPRFNKARAIDEPIKPATPVTRRRAIAIHHKQCLVTFAQDPRILSELAGCPACSANHDDDHTAARRARSEGDLYDLVHRKSCALVATESQRFGRCTLHQRHDGDGGTPIGGADRKS